jgi:phosphinothricin acetyltransferase
MSQAARIRPATLHDAAAMATVYAPYVTDSVASFEEVPPTAEEMAGRMSRAPALPWLIAEREAAPVGFAYGSHHRSRAGYRWSVDCSVYLADQERGRGTARALYERLLPELAALGYVSAFAGIVLPNDASVGFHESMGFELVGIYKHVGFKNRAWLDVGWWQRLLRDPPAAPNEPRPWQQAASR